MSTCYSTQAHWLSGVKFRFPVNGRILTITRTDEDAGWDWDLKLRAYMPTEDIPYFTSTVYTYYGLDGEEYPEDTTEVIFHPSATIIKEAAFYECKSLVRVTMPDNVTRVKEDAFYDCGSLTFIRLSANLAFIRTQAFCECNSLESVFLPPIVHVDNYAFGYCTSLRFFLCQSQSHILVCMSCLAVIDY